MLTTLLLVASVAALPSEITSTPMSASTSTTTTWMSHARLDAVPRIPSDGSGRGGGRLELRRPALHQEDEWDEPPVDDEHARHPHLLLSGWGGEALAHGGSGRSSSFYGGEVAWAFSQLDVGVAASWYRALRDATRAWTPVFLTRVTQRFMTRRGFEAAFSLGFGAGRPSGWIGWYQVAVGLRVPLGPVFVGGELAFEQYDIIRLGGGLGLAF